MVFLTAYNTASGLSSAQVQVNAVDCVVAVIILTLGTPNIITILVIHCKMEQSGLAVQYHAKRCRMYKNSVGHDQIAQSSSLFWVCTFAKANLSLYSEFDWYYIIRKMI